MTTQISSARGHFPRGWQRAALTGHGQSALNRMVPSGYPDDWTLTIDPSRVELARDEERAVEVTIEPRFPAFTGEKTFNVRGFALTPDGATRQSVGGVTLHV